MSTWVKERVGQAEKQHGHIHTTMCGRNSSWEDAAEHRSSAPCSDGAEGGMRGGGEEAQEEEDMYTYS